MPELVLHGQTGMIGETDEELAQPCREVGAINRSRCRQEPVWRFSVEAMTHGYERVYDDVIVMRPRVGSGDALTIERLAGTLRDGDAPALSVL